MFAGGGADKDKGSNALEQKSFVHRACTHCLRLRKLTFHKGPPILSQSFLVRLLPGGPGPVVKDLVQQLAEGADA